MNNYNLRAILLKIQDQLSDNDRKRLSFLLKQDDSSVEGIPCPVCSLITNSDQITEQNITYLTKIFEQIQCDDAAKLLKEYINQIHSVIPLTPVQDDEKCTMQTFLSDQKCYSNNNNVLINSNNTNINPIIVVPDSQLKFPLRRKKKYLLNIPSMTLKCLLLFIILSIILAGLVIISSVQIIRLKRNYDSITNDHIKNKEIIEHLKKLESNVSQIVQQLIYRANTSDKEQGKITAIAGDHCRCESWCQKRNYTGGICGDGYTCICSK